MSDAMLTHDANIGAFDDAGSVVETTDSGVTFSWDEENIVHVDAPADLEGAFDTDRFYKISDATIARPIKQPYLENDEIKWYKKPAEELQKAAWSFDNVPFTLGHPNTGMVKNVDDIHGFWRNPHYDADEDRLREDLYIPANDEQALSFIEENQDVSVGFYNRVHSDYDGHTGELTDDDVDGFQTDLYGNHIAGVEKGRCSSEHGCGLDDQPHGTVIPTQKMDYTIEADGAEDITVDYRDSDGNYYAVGPDENPDGDSPKYPINNCSDATDAWNLRKHGNYTITQSQLEMRIKRRADKLGCTLPSTAQDAADCGCGGTENTNTETTTMTDENDSGFDIPDLSADAIVEQNDAVREIKEERDALRSDIDEMRSEIQEAFDSAEHFSIELDDGECPCEAVDELVADLDEKVEKVESLQDELSEYREAEKEEALDSLTELGADRDEWADESLDTIEEEIERREEVLDAAPDTSVKDVDSSTDSADESESEKTISGTRTFGRGHGA